LNVASPWLSGQNGDHLVSRDAEGTGQSSGNEERSGKARSSGAFSSSEPRLELVMPRTDRVNGGVVFHEEKLHALGLLGTLASFGDTGGVFRGHEDRGCGIWRAGHLHRNFFALAFPVARNPSLGRGVVNIHPVQISDHIGFDDGVFEAGRGWVGKFTFVYLKKRFIYILFTLENSMPHV
jgi:hypothetical protein